MSNCASELLDQIVKDENISLEKFIPLKVHFGKKGNTTYIKSNNYAGIIKYLKGKNIDSAFVETNVLYRGERTTKEKHVKLAIEHGFLELPIIIADDVGVFASIDPVAIDMACLDMVDKNNNKTIVKRGRHTYDYGEKIGLGSKEYELVEIK